MLSFKNKLQKSIQDRNSNLCVGIDIDKSHFSSDTSLQELKDHSFKVIESTREFAAAYKPNLAFFEEWGSEGFVWLEELIQEIGNEHIIIADAKRGDIGNSAKHYANAFFNHFNCDAITVNPYMGADTIEPFCSNPEKGAYILCVTSNPSASKIQNDSFKNVIDLTNNISQHDNVGLVIGATNIEKMEEVRRLSRLPFLIPGIGAQGGDLENTIKINKQFINSTLINVSRSIIFADDIFGAAKEFLEKMRGCIER
tara:strand:+ start:135 stop:899 length:765 start_codon:yes stop_codon:yes gene_type:complete